jgi:hypothetical protein
MAKETFKVWDAINASEDSSSDIEAGDPHEAAEVYAEQDVDGNIDGIYTRAHPVMVREADGTLHKFEITVEYYPVYYATKK